jgi:hypothetical protein
MTHDQDQIAEGRSREPRERAQAFSRVKAQSYTETRALAD